MINRDHFLNLASGYVLNALDDEERAQFEELLKSAPEDLKKEFEKLQSAAQYLPLVVKQNEPPTELKEELITQIKKLSLDNQKEESIPRPRSLFERLAHFIGFHRPQIAIVVIAILLIVTIGFIFLSSKLYNTDEYQHKNLINLKSQLSKKNYLLTILQKKETKMDYLQGTSIDSSSYGKIFFDPGTSKAVLLVSNLPKKPAKTFYALWYKQGSKIMSAGVFSITDTLRFHYFALNNFSRYDAKKDLSFFITVEHNPGAQHPTGKIYLRSK